MKKNIVGLIIGVLVLSMGFSYADNFNIEKYRVDILVDNNPIDIYDYEQRIEMPPFTYEGRTLLPMRRMFEIFGLEVTWNPEDWSITSTTKEGKEIWLQIDNQTVRVNGEDLELDVPAKLVNNRTYVPVRFITETIGYDIEWVDATKTVVITTNPLSLPVAYADDYASFYNSVEKSLLIEAKSDITKKILVQENGIVLSQAIEGLAAQLNLKTEVFKYIEMDQSAYVAYKDFRANQIYEVLVKKDKKVYHAKFEKFTENEMKKYVGLIFN